MVHIQQFLKQTQNQEEGVRSFLTRHRRVAAHCELRERCWNYDCDVSYSDTIVQFKLIAGLSDAEIKIIVENKKDTLWEHQLALQR